MESGKSLTPAGGCRIWTAQTSADRNQDSEIIGKFFIAY
jgi:hypothetical protein